MTADQFVGVVAISGMLFLVVSRLASDQMPRHKLLRMGLAWIAIIVVVVAVALAAR